MTSALSSRPASPLAPYSTLAAVALALTFFTVVGGIVCGHVALSRIARTGERGRWLAIAALVLGYGAVALGAALFVSHLLH